MGLLSPETEKLIAEQAARTGETPDALVRRKLAEQAPRRPNLAGMQAAIERFQALPLHDARPWREIRDELWSE
ncbi:MAG: hypothetical protein K2X11_07515 [Acetobacteraceae bacterium]|nr:hypothetical protein [Acetobacteraceae bacterium]